VRSFLLSQLQDLNINVGLYWENGLAINNATPRALETIKKEICGITIEANKQIISFLDVTFDPNQTTSNHLQSQILHYNTPIARETIHPWPRRTFPPASTNDCRPYHLTKHPLTKPHLHTRKHSTKAGYHNTLQYEPAKASKCKNWKRNKVLWYNPRFSKDTSTNIEHKFLALLDKHFPNDHKLRKIISTETASRSVTAAWTTEN